MFDNKITVSVVEVDGTRKVSAVEVDGVKYVHELTKDLFARDSEGLPYVILRSSGAGVHAGYLKELDKATQSATLYNSRRLWQWHGRTLSGLALEGTDDATKCKFGDVLPENIIFGVYEVIFASETSRVSLEAVARWENV